MWQETTRHERNRRIWEEELDAFVPQRVLDIHVHIVNAGVVPEGDLYRPGGIPLQKYDFEDLEQDLADAYPGRDTYAVCFGSPNPIYDTRRNNAYVAEHCDNQRFFGLRLLDPLMDTPELLHAELSCGDFLGVKPYPRYTRHPDLNDAQIPEMLPDWSMEIVNDLGQMVMLHIPRKMRLADPLNQQHLVELCTKYPKAKILLAHIGRAYYLKNVYGNLERLRELPNLYYDLTMVQNWEVMEHTFDRVDRDKVVFGTDIPIALAPGKAVEINHQYTYVTPKPWAISITDDHGKIVFTSFLYEELRAMKRAVERLGLDRAYVEGMFYGNGMKLLKEVLKGNPQAAVKPALAASVACVTGEASHHDR